MPTVPRILEDSPTQIVRQVCLHEPCAVVLVMTFWPLSDLPSADRKFSTTADADFRRDFQVWEKLLKCCPVERSSFGIFVLEIKSALRVLILKRTDLDGTAQRPYTSKIYIALLFYEWDLQLRKYLCFIVQWVVRMPLISICMPEKQD